MESTLDTLFLAIFAWFMSWATALVAWFVADVGGLDSSTFFFPLQLSLFLIALAWILRGRITRCAAAARDRVSHTR